MNRLFKCTLMLAFCAGLTACSDRKVVTGDYAVIPLPQETTLTDGSPFILGPSTKIVYSEAQEGMKDNAEFLASYIKEITGYDVQIANGEMSNAINLVIDSRIDSPEGYELQVLSDKITITGSTKQGVFYGLQTLRKTIPAKAQGMDVSFPAVTIKDYPRFAYRGMMLDVSRHFFPVDSVKTYIDILALHNMNTFHWHLTDDQGWRIEIKKYPELTQIGSQRKQTVIGRNSGEYDGKEYGGFYTQEQIKEVVAYAAKRNINIIPEIDLPGHQLAALTTYPELGCTGGPYEVWGQWGVADDVICAGNEKSMLFLEDVLSEVIDLFPSKLIHIGGDECPKVRWEKCPKCQARIKALGIKGDKRHTAEEYLQSYVITRMSEFVASKGRQIIGWDEILEGGLAPGATVMSWRSMEGGIEAARQQHNAVMVPSSHMYFDYYQSTDTENEPFAIGGYIPLEKVYSFEPTDGVDEANKQYIIGVQANLWTEYIPTFSQVEYMVLPRMDALCETQWSDPSKKDYQSFLPRLARMTQLYDCLGYNYAKHIFDINATITPDTDKGAIIISLLKLGEGDIYYTLDGTNPTATSPRYESPVEIRQNGTFKAIVIRPDGSISRTFAEEITFDKGTTKLITLKEEPSRGYSFNGAVVLADGLHGNDNYKTGRWLGFQGKDIDATIDLKDPTEISKISFNTNVVKGDWIMGAAGITVKVSDDGKTFREVASKQIPELTKDDKDGLYPQEITFAPMTTRYVEVVINSSKLPKWHSGAGNPAYLFVDEIEVQ